MQILSYNHTYYKEIVELYYHAVHAIDNKIYSEKQKVAWASKPIDYQKWATRLQQIQPYVGLVNDKVIGFIEFEPDGHIDCFYVDPDYQGLGYGRMLYQYVEKMALYQGVSSLYVEASYIAKPIFEHYGFDMVKKNHVMRNNVELINFSMRLNLRDRE